MNQSCILYKRTLSDQNIQWQQHLYPWHDLSHFPASQYFCPVSIRSPPHTEKQVEILPSQQHLDPGHDFPHLPGSQYFKPLSLQVRSPSSQVHRPSSSHGHLSSSANNFSQQQQWSGSTMSWTPQVLSESVQYSKPTL